MRSDEAMICGGCGVVKYEYKRRRRKEAGSMQAECDIPLDCAISAMTVDVQWSSNASGTEQGSEFYDTGTHSTIKHHQYGLATVGRLTEN